MRNNTLAKTISLVTTLLFCMTTVAYAQPHKVYTITVPEEYGQVKERYQGSSDEVVVHIQDAHTSFQAQKNLCNLIEYLVNQNGVDMVAAEGAEGNANLDVLRDLPAIQGKQQVAEWLMQEGRLTGTEVANIMSPAYFTVQGVEDMDLYDINYDAFVNTLNKREEILDQIEQVENILNDLKTSLYSDNTKAFDTVIKEYRTGAINFFEYCGKLLSYATKNGIDIAHYVNFTMLLEAKAWEEQIDFDKVDTEREALIDEVQYQLDGKTDTLSQKKSEIFNRELAAFQERKNKKNADNAPFFTLLKNLGAEFKLNDRRFENCNNFATYLSLFVRLDKAGLLGECRTLERAIEDRIATKENEKQLIQLSRSIRMLKDIVELKVLPEDVAYYRANKAQFSSKVFSQFIKNNAPEITVGEGISLLDEILPSVDDFYRFAEERSTVLTNNAVEQMKAKGESILPLVAGGFHTDGITKTLKEKGISYIVVTPQIEEAVEDVPYLDRMLNVPTTFQMVVEAAYNAIVHELAQAAEKHYQASLAEYLEQHPGEVGPPFGVTPLTTLTLEFMDKTIGARIAYLPQTQQGDQQVFDFTDAINNPTYAYLLAKARETYNDNDLEQVSITYYTGTNLTDIATAFDNVQAKDIGLIQEEKIQKVGVEEAQTKYTIFFTDGRIPVEVAELATPEKYDVIAAAIQNQEVSPVPFVQRKEKEGELGTETDFKKIADDVIVRSIARAFGKDVGELKQELVRNINALTHVVFGQPKPSTAISLAGTTIPIGVPDVYEVLLNEAAQANQLYNPLEDIEQTRNAAEREVTTEGIPTFIPFSVELQQKLQSILPEMTTLPSTQRSIDIIVRGIAFAKTVDTFVNGAQGAQLLEKKPTLYEAIKSLRAELLKQPIIQQYVSLPYSQLPVQIFSLRVQKIPTIAQTLAPLVEYLNEINKNPVNVKNTTGLSETPYKTAIEGVYQKDPNILPTFTAWTYKAIEPALTFLTYFESQKLVSLMELFNTFVEQKVKELAEQGTISTTTQESITNLFSFPVSSTISTNMLQDYIVKIENIAEIVNAVTYGQPAEIQALAKNLDINQTELSIVVDNLRTFSEDFFQTQVLDYPRTPEIANSDYVNMLLYKKMLEDMTPRMPENVQEDIQSVIDIFNTLGTETPELSRIVSVFNLMSVSAEAGLTAAKELQGQIPVLSRLITNAGFSTVFIDLVSELAPIQVAPALNGKRAENTGRMLQRISRAIALRQAIQSEIDKNNIKPAAVTKTLALLESINKVDSFQLYNTITRIAGLVKAFEQPALMQDAAFLERQPQDVQRAIRSFVQNVSNLTETVNTLEAQVKTASDEAMTKAVEKSVATTQSNLVQAAQLSEEFQIRATTVKDTSLKAALEQLSTLMQPDIADIEATPIQIQTELARVSAQVTFFNEIQQAYGTEYKLQFSSPELLKQVRAQAVEVKPGEVYQLDNIFAYPDHKTKTTHINIAYVNAFFEASKQRAHERVVDSTLPEFNGAEMLTEVMKHELYHLEKEDVSQDFVEVKEMRAQEEAPISRNTAAAAVAVKYEIDDTDRLLKIYDAAYTASRDEVNIPIFASPQEGGDNMLVIQLNASFVEKINFGNEEKFKSEVEGLISQFQMVKEKYLVIKGWNELTKKDTEIKAIVKQNIADPLGIRHIIDADEAGSVYGIDKNKIVLGLRNDIQKLIKDATVKGTIQGVALDTDQSLKAEGYPETLPVLFVSRLAFPLLSKNPSEIEGRTEIGALTQTVPGIFEVNPEWLRGIGFQELLENVKKVLQALNTQLERERIDSQSIYIAA